MLAAISLSVRGLPCGPPNKSSAVCMCRLARIAAMIPMTRLRPSSMDEDCTPFAVCSPSHCATLSVKIGKIALQFIHHETLDVGCALDCYADARPSSKED